ncbi:hypothetical protein R1flu_027989 [Riccia fluitans]|uniref:Uncharacterized protein n=1 Tax=Riccia fluitans TaxID=41844 RepID=A0ABD1XNC5_9MARC
MVWKFFGTPKRLGVAPKGEPFILTGERLPVEAKFCQWRQIFAGGGEPIASTSDRFAYTGERFASSGKGLLAPKLEKLA